MLLRCTSFMKCTLIMFCMSFESIRDALEKLKVLISFVFFLCFLLNRKLGWVIPFAPSAVAWTRLPVFMVVLH